MREQPHYDHLLTKEFFNKYYISERMSYPELRQMLLRQGYNIHVGTLYKYAKKNGIGRTVSEGIRNLQEQPLDWGRSFLDERVIEALDGFILGDGGIDPIKNDGGAARLKCGVEHEMFCSYMMNFFSAYASTSSKVNDPSMKQAFRWEGRTLSHPDLWRQYLRWYPEMQSGKREKQPPDDVRITPISVMLWYLGDGCIVEPTENAIALRLSTDSFLPAKVEFLASRMAEKGIPCHRNNDNRVYVEAKGIPAFFDFIGRKSPVKCYDYKFDLPEWRLTSKRMGQVAEELGIDYQHLAYKVKIGEVQCFRASENGKPRFMPEHVEALRAIIAGSPETWKKG